MEKHFRKQEDWQRETELYAALSGKLPVLTVLHSEQNVLVTRYQKGVTLLDSLNR